MALSRLAPQFAAEIHQHDWSDAPYRLDRAGHQREHDLPNDVPQMSPEETDRIRTNVMWVVAQVLGYQDPNFDPYEFADAAGVRTKTRSGHKDGYIMAGLRIAHEPELKGHYARPGTWDTYDE
ncbi:hypothetical protein [Amycolatopsis sp. GM8]|uniref:hypothetical protein n=1 Tax=Amycolatopsis sp. GM8 TaxID=2896530 RepID=UPI001F1CA2ED|nr:hypothetical protein [Amycolatopsis sp. GM8]